MINEQQELRTLAKALSDRGHARQAGVVRELSLMKEAQLLPQPPDMDVLVNKWRAMIGAGRAKFDEWRGAKAEQKSAMNKDVYNGDDVDQWKKISDALTSHYVSLLTRGVNLEVRFAEQSAADKLKSIKEAKDGLIDFEEDHLAEGRTQKATMFTAAYKIFTPSTEVNRHRKMAWQESQPILWYFVHKGGHLRSWYDAHKEAHDFYVAQVQTDKAAKEGAAKSERTQAASRKALENQAKILKTQRPGTVTPDGIEGTINGYGKPDNSLTVRSKSDPNKFWWKHFCYETSNAATDGTFGQAWSSFRVRDNNHWKQLGSTLPPKHSSWKRGANNNGGFKKESSLERYELTKQAKKVVDADQPGVQKSNVDFNTKAKAKAKGGKSPIRSVALPASMTAAGINSKATGDKFRLFLNNDHPKLAKEADLDLPGRGRRWNNKFMVAAWNLMESKGIKWTVKDGEIKESEPQAKLAPVSKDTLRAYLLYPKELGARDTLTARYGDDSGVTLTVINAAITDELKKKRDIDINDMIASGSESAKLLSEAYHKDTTGDKNDPGSENAALRLKRYLRVSIRKEKAAAAKREKDAEEAKATEATSTQVRYNDYYIVGADGNDVRYDQVSNLPPAGTLFVSKKNGDIYYLATVDNKSGLARLSRRPNGYGLNKPGQSILTKTEVARLLGLVNPKERDLWEKFLSDDEEYTRELAKPGEGGGWFQDSRDTDLKDRQKSWAALFGGKSKPLQAGDPGRTPDGKPRTVGLA